MPGKSLLADAFVIAACAAGSAGRAAGPFAICIVKGLDGNPLGDLSLVAMPCDLLSLVRKDGAICSNGI